MLTALDLSSPIKIAGTTETRRLLTSWDDVDVQAMRDLWDSSSGARGMLDAMPASRGVRNGWIWDGEHYRRTSSGRIVSDRELRNYVRKISKATRDGMKKETQQLIAGAIIGAVWYSRTRNLLKTLYHTVWLIGIGGFLFDDDLQRNLFYAFCLIQFIRHDNFARQLNTGEQALDGSATSRAGMYGTAGNSVYQNVGLDRAKKRGYIEGRRILGPNENHCEDTGERPGCIDEALKGWQPIARVLPIGEAACYTNCLCHIEYRRRVKI